MSKHIHIITLSMLALSISATTRTETAQRDRLINSLEGTCLPKELEALVDKINEQEKQCDECWHKKETEDPEYHHLNLNAMRAFRDFGRVLTTTMPPYLEPVYSPILKNLDHMSMDDSYAYGHYLQDAWQELEQLAILQEKKVDDRSSLTPEQQTLAEQAISLHKLAREYKYMGSRSDFYKAVAAKNESLKELGEKLTQVDSNNDTSLEKPQASVLVRLADHALQSCEKNNSMCPNFINTYLAARKAMVQATKEQK